MALRRELHPVKPAINPTQGNRMSQKTADQKDNADPFRLWVLLVRLFGQPDFWMFEV